MADDASDSPMGADELLDVVEAIMRTFGADGTPSDSAAALDTARILDNLTPDMARAALMITAAVIRWAAHETGHSEEELLSELRRHS